MKYYTLLEVKEFINYAFEVKMPRDYYNSPIETASVCFDAYDGEMSEGLTEYVVLALIIGKNIKKYNNRIFIGQYNIVMSAVEKALSKSSELQLNEDEKREIIELAGELKELLPKMIIEYDPFAK